MRITDRGKNTTELNARGKLILFSYSTPVAMVNGKNAYRTEKKFGTATNRHINKWLSGGCQEATEKPQEFFDNLLE